LYYPKDNLIDAAFKNLENAISEGFDKLFDEHKKAWEEKWKLADIYIEGDVAAQQGIRFNIFQLLQTYNGKDERLNIGPKGFTGEKYGGVTYWDTEAYCLPFYMSTNDAKVAKNLLIYRYKHLPKAIENAEKLGFSDGAALFPMVTINGEECHNEWEITFEEIHRNGAIAYAIFNYIRYTGDKQYLAQFGLEVLIGIARFWAQRVNFSQEKQKYVMLGVTGPNEYENNVNNNWYTSTIALWSMKYAIESIEFVKNNFPDDFKKITDKTKFHLNETEKWQNIIDNMYLPYDEKRQIFLQQDGFLDKELIPASEIPKNQRPINKHWSWDKILRSCYIKQADVLQGLFFFEENYDIETIKRNFDFYEPLTVHESSLSPSVYSIIAAKIGNKHKAYELYLRTARLDLDDYNDEVAEGLHITSMAGTWMSIVYGFAGMRIKDNKLSFSPFLPEKWKSFEFRIFFRDWLLSVKITDNSLIVRNLSDKEIEIFVKNENHKIVAQSSITAKI
jgi:maltose phosphorylase